MSGVPGPLAIKDIWREGEIPPADGNVPTPEHPIRIDLEYPARIFKRDALPFGTMKYFLDFPEDIRMFGGSFDTAVRPARIAEQRLGQFVDVLTGVVVVEKMKLVTVFRRRGIAAPVVIRGILYW